MIRPLRAALLAATSASMTCAFAWIDTGHMVVAEIAERNLSPKVKRIVQELARTGTDERTNTLVTCSCWADDHKSDADRAWHYINIHFRQDGKSVTNTPPQENVVWAISRFSKVLANKKAQKEDRALALRYLVHFIGDIHQPLHAVARDSDNHPDGDRGGNDFKFTPIDGWGDRPVSNLHALWDFGCGEFRPLSRPLDGAATAKLKKLATDIMREYPRQKVANLRESDPSKWARESFSIASQFCYSLNEDQAVPDAYLKRGRDISRRRAATAGYRLADLLNRILG